MEKGHIITVNSIETGIDFNWAIKRYALNSKRNNSTIIGLHFPWKRIFRNSSNIGKISGKAKELFNEFAKGSFFKSIDFTPQQRDVFILKIKQFSSYYWIEFIFKKDQWNLKTKEYSWEKETFIFSHGNNSDEDFIVSKIGYENGYDKRKYHLPIYIDNESFMNSHYQFYFGKSDGLRRDLRVRGCSLLIDHDFDYFLHIRSNEFSEITGRTLDFVMQGQVPTTIIFQLLKVLHESKNFSYYGGGAILDLPQTHFIFKMENKIYKAGILSRTGRQDPELKNLEELEDIILKWIDKIVEFHKQN
jgi:hypothetical protein